jgi:menaquinone-9 beta-reductase
MYDVVVVGGSLAGATTAAQLALAGRSVLLLERAKSPRRKACGEGMFPRGVRELERLGLLEEVAGHGRPLRSVRFHGTDAAVAAPLGADGSVGLGIQRTELDPRMLAFARRSGVEVSTGTTARELIPDGHTFTGVRTDGGDIQARVIVR